VKSQETVLPGKYINMAKIKPLYPFDSHYQDIRGFQYHYVDEGHGEPLVMVHGNPTWSFFFRSLIKGLSGNFRTLAPDHIGCGLSEKPDEKNYPYDLKSRVEDLDAFLDKLGLNQKLTFIVHDWGGMIAMAWATLHPEKIGRLVILNTSAFMPPGGKRIPLRLQVIRRIRPLAGPAVLGLNLFALGALVMGPKKKLAKDVKRGLIAPYNCRACRTATLKFVQDIPLKKSDPAYAIVRQTEQGLHRLENIPMLILWGAHDFVFDMDYFREWQRRFPNARCRVFSDAGHYILEDVPDKVLEHIRTFLIEHPLV